MKYRIVWSDGINADYSGPDLSIEGEKDKDTWLKLGFKIRYLKSGFYFWLEEVKSKRKKR